MRYYRLEKVSITRLRVVVAIQELEYFSYISMKIIQGLVLGSMIVYVIHHVISASSCVRQEC